MSKNLKKNVPICRNIFKFCALCDLGNTPTKFDFRSSSKEKVINKYISALCDIIHSAQKFTLESLTRKIICRKICEVS